MADGLREERACYARLLGTRDRREALEAFGQKRAATFVGQ